jgi:hypothetical protein
LYFARLFGNDEAGVYATSTAVLQRARYIGPGALVFPFAIEDDVWGTLSQGDVITIYGDGRIENESGGQIPGNWGTVNIGPANNSTSDLSAQIRDGLRQSDLDSLESQGVIPSSDFIDASIPVDLKADPGLSAGLKHAVQGVHGTMKIAPIYGSASGNGANAKFEIVGWTAVEVVDSTWTGRNKSVEVRKSYLYDRKLLPVNDLSDLSNTIEGAFTIPVLVQ